MKSDAGVLPVVRALHGAGVREAHARIVGDLREILAVSRPNAVPGTAARPYLTGTFRQDLGAGG